jgi:hypothetical protein
VKWDQGRAVIDRSGTELQRVPPSREQAGRLIAQANAHTSSARAHFRAVTCPLLG